MLRDSQGRFVEAVVPLFKKLHASFDKWDAHRITASSAFAELYGAMLGDGCIYTYGNSLCIVGNAKLDSHYVSSYLASLFEELFNITPHIYRDSSKIRLVVNNNECIEKLVSIGYVRGRKKDKSVEIPQFIFNDEDLLKSCIRGLFDTDGGVYSHPHTGIMMDITCKHAMLLSSLHKALRCLNIQGGLLNTGFVCYAQKAVTFLNAIGSSNLRNVGRYLSYIRDGRVPEANNPNLALINEFEITLPFKGPVV